MQRRDDNAPDAKPPGCTTNDEITECGDRADSHLFDPDRGDVGVEADYGHSGRIGAREERTVGAELERLRM